MIIKILKGVNLDSMSIRKILKRFGEFVRVRHRRFGDKNRDDRNSFSERRFDFYPNKVRRFGDAGMAVRSFSSPIRANNRQQYVSAAERFVDVLSEINAEWNIVDIAKNSVGTIMRDEPIKDSSDDRPAFSDTVNSYQDNHINGNRQDVYGSLNLYGSK